jgi:lysophospholipase L1-like esterase
VFTASVLFIVLILMAAELGARYYERHRSDPPDYFPSIYYRHKSLRYALIPNLDYYGWFRINSLGFRGPEVTYEKKPGVLRVVCLGGSTTFDIGSVGPAQPWPEVLEAALRKRLGTQSVEVLNLGIPGATSFDSLIDLQLRVLPLQPDLVIVYQGHNDINYSAPQLGSSSSPLYPGEISPRSSLFRWLQYNSLLYAKLEERVTRRIGGLFGVFNRSPASGSLDVDQLRAKALQRGLATFRSNITSIAAIARANHLPLVLLKLVQPFPVAGKTDNCSVCKDLSSSYGGIDQVSLRSLFDGYDSVLAEVAAQGNGVYHVVTDGFVPSADRYYNDPIHFGPEGSRLMGTNLSEALAPILQEIRSQPETASNGPRSAERQTR